MATPCLGHRWGKIRFIVSPEDSVLVLGWNTDHPVRNPPILDCPELGLSRQVLQSVGPTLSNTVRVITSRSHEWLPVIPFVNTPHRSKDNNPPSYLL